MFTSKLSKSALSLATCFMNGLLAAANDALSATKEIRELKNGDDIKEITMSYEFAVVSFYKPSDEKSVEVNGFFEGAFSHFNEMMWKNEWEQREVGWFRVNMETENEIKMSDDPD